MTELFPGYADFMAAIWFMLIFTVVFFIIAAALFCGAIALYRRAWDKSEVEDTERKGG